MWPSFVALPVRVDPMGLRLALVMDLAVEEAALESWTNEATPPEPLRGVGVDGVSSATA